MSSLTLVSLLGSVPLGALGWLATNFVARPILRAHELREKVWEELLVSANVSLFEAGLYERAIESLRRCAAQASALDVAWPSTLRWVLRLLRINLREASTGLLGFSNTFGRPNPDSTAFLRQAAAALRLPAEVIARAANDKPDDTDDHSRRGIAHARVMADLTGPEKRGAPVSQPSGQALSRSACTSSLPD